MFSIFKKKIIVPHIRLAGVIGSAGRFKQGIDFSGQQEIIKKAFSFKKAKSIAISINSPGGSPVQSHLIHDYIRQLAKKNNKKVIVFAEDVAASGGYLIACAGDEIYANSSSIVGSIGVISASFGFQDAIKRIGVQRRVYTAGKNKSTLDPFKEEKPEDIERIKKLQLELHSDLINLVKNSRGSKLKDPDKNNTFTGEVSEISDQKCKVKLSNAEIMANPISVKSKGEKTKVSLRPERALINPKDKMDNIHNGKIEEVIYHGDHTRVRINLLGNPEFILKVPNSSANLDIKLGNEIKIGWNSQDARALDPK